VTAERYIAVFTGFFTRKKPGEYLYLIMSRDSLGPEGGYTLHRGRPPYERLGREIKFQDQMLRPGVTLLYLRGI
jgi:hypothetical protein